MDFNQVFKSWVLLALGVLLAANTADGIHYDNAESLIFAVILLSVCNVFLKPVLMLFSLPFIILTLGLGIWLINALLFLLVGGLVGGFHVESFAYALWGALVVSVTGGIANLLFGKKERRGGVHVRAGRVPDPRAGTGSGRARRTPLKDDEDVIDI